MFAAIDDLADAQSVTDAYEVYVAYLRERGMSVRSRARGGELRQRQGLGRLRRPAGRPREGRAGAVAGRLIATFRGVLLEGPRKPALHLRRAGLVRSQ